MRRLCISGTAGLIALVLGALGGPEQHRAVAQADKPLPAVIVAPVVSKPISATVEFVGRTEAFRKVEIRARVTGVLLDCAFAEGGTVKSGDLLYDIDPAEFIARRDAAAAAVQRVEATIREAERQLARYEELTAKGTASEAKLDEAKAKAGQARADLAAAKAELVQAEINLGYTKITSPIDGRIGRSSVDAGNLIGTDSGVLATVVTLDPIHVVFSISEREHLNYEKHTKAGTVEQFTPRIRLSNDELFPNPGKIDFIDNEIDATTGTLQARMVFPNPDKLILPGQFVRVEFTSAEPKERLVVPQAAVQQNQAGPFVLVVDADNKVEARPITIGRRIDAEIVVTEGLRSGEQIIVEGIQKVRPGAQVKPVPAEG
ncbi:MAG: efflux RND transporter periplasmic adaptor subunit [Hyphomicrobiales bacterium]